MATKTKPEDKDPVIMGITSGCILFTFMSQMQPAAVHTPGPLGNEEAPPTIVGTFALSWFQTVVIIFATGWIKVWLDVKRGATSVSEMESDLQDQRGWLHKKMGIDNRGGVLPNQNRPQRRRRENATEDTNNELID